MKVVLCCILSHVQHTTHCHVFKVIYLSHAMWQCVTPQALLSSTACSRLSDSGEDAKDKAFSCLRFLNSADPTISEPGAGYFVYISLQEGDMGVYGIAVLNWAFFMQYIITVILILTCGIAVSSSFAVCGFSSFWPTVFGEIRLFTVLRYRLFAFSFRYNTQSKTQQDIKVNAHWDCDALWM